MGEELFRFKSFSVSHSRSSMKVGVDAVLLGAWAGVKAGRFLEVGSGCGVISLQLASRFPGSQILAVDIDPASVEESELNFRNSCFKGLVSLKREFPIDFHESETFDLIVSNPPFYKSGVDNPVSPREKARHCKSLSPLSLIHHSSKLLNVEGRLSMIFPADQLEEINMALKDSGLITKRICFVRNNLNRPVKRVMLEFEKRKEEEDDQNTGHPMNKEYLTLFENGIPTDDYQKLCGDFYLDF